MCVLQSENSNKVRVTVGRYLVFYRKVLSGSLFVFKSENGTLKSDTSIKYQQQSLNITSSIQLETVDNRIQSIKRPSLPFRRHSDEPQSAFRWLRAVMDVDNIHSKQIVPGTLIAFKPRKTNRKLRSDDICFQCGCTGELIQCDDCPRVFHLECISNLDDIPEGAWRCPWHSCSTCGKEVETAFYPGYYCVHCPTSYCSVCAADSSSNDCVSLRIFATLFPPEMNIFSSLRRSGFTLQHPNSLLFVCPGCTSNTEAAVCEINGPVNGNADLKKASFKISTALMHKKLLRSFSAPPSKAFYQTDTIELTTSGESLTETSVDSSVIVPNQIDSDVNDKLPVQIRVRVDDSNGIDLRKDEICTDSKILILSQAEHSPDNSNASETAAAMTADQSSEDVCVITFSPAVPFDQPDVTANCAVTTTTGPSSSSAPSRANMLEYPAVRKFFSSPSTGTLCKMRAKGWTFLYPFPISESSQAPNSHLAHKLVGCRCRRYFSGYGMSDGVLVAHLAGKRNDGLTLLHCVHDDEDEEDLDEEEAAIAADDFNSDCKTKNESIKLRHQRKLQMELEVQALGRAQGETQVIRAATTLSRTAIISDACKRAPVECIGYHMRAVTPTCVTDSSGTRTNTESNAVETPSGQTPIVLKRFSNAKEAATRMMKSMAEGSSELSSNNGALLVPQTVNEGGGAGTGKKDSGTEGGGGGGGGGDRGSDFAERTRLSAWRKEIVRCCRGQRAYFLGLKWQFAFPRLACPVSAEDQHNLDIDRTDNHNRQQEAWLEEGDLTNRVGPVRSTDECDPTVAASQQRRIRPRGASVGAPQATEHDAFSLLRAECSQSQVRIMMT